MTQTVVSFRIPEQSKKEYKHRMLTKIWSFVWIYKYKIGITVIVLFIVQTCVTNW